MNPIAKAGLGDQRLINLPRIHKFDPSLIQSPAICLSRAARVQMHLGAGVPITQSPTPGDLGKPFNRSGPRSPRPPGHECHMHRPQTPSTKGCWAGGLPWRPSTYSLPCGHTYPSPT